ncbi:class I tRNA ligase family protein [Candidatus Microgenomates bacterium]|nr:class I tRNA ligase family protein [Candidatus Microgenomates bacterium]
MIVSTEKPKTCPTCGGSRLIQDADTLDTWFSSALWPFATLGWPKETADLKYFYPTTVLSTARDIIFLWVARMVFSSLEFMDKEIPFSQVYIHPTIFNKEGKRMSKSLGTGVDPLELIEKYGADATRFGLMYMNTGTQDIKFSEEAILAARNFCNKIWNASRFVLSQPKPYPLSPGPSNHPDDQWILEQLEKTIKSVNADLDHFRFGQAAHTLYDFFWHDFCDKYLEISKKRREEAQPVLLYVLENSLKLLHPFMPFITEEIYQLLPHHEKSIMTADWPKA